MSVAFIGNCSSGFNGARRLAPATPPFPGNTLMGMSASFLSLLRRYILPRACSQCLKWPATVGGKVIRLTRLNNKSLTVNSDLIKFVEQSPDTLITLVTGEKIVVRESAEEILARFVEFRRSVLQGLAAWDSSALHPAIPCSSETHPPEPQT